MLVFVTVGVPPVGVTLTDTLAVARRLCAYRGTQLAQVASRELELQRRRAAGRGTALGGAELQLAVARAFPSAIEPVADRAASRSTVTFRPPHVRAGSSVRGRR